MLSIRSITVRVAGRVLLDDATVSIPPGHHVGLIGRNGTGKSTLLRVIGGELQPDTGSVELSGPFGRGNAIGWVRQEAPGGTETPIEHVLAADRERAALTAEAETATDPHRIAEIQTRLIDIGAHAAPARAARILAGLGFDEEMQNRPLSEYSGGWRMRVALAAVLFQEPELLLLDEPTNQLDLETTVWLEGHLKVYPKTLIVVSHDRHLLNEVATSILHVEGLKLVQYTGNYDTFERVREARLALLDAQRVKQELQRKHLQSFVDRFRYKASKARQAQSRLKLLEKMEVATPVVEEALPSFDFPAPDPLSPPLLNLEGVDVGYEPGKPVLRGLDIRIDMDDRIALLGSNGNGKSTLAKLLAGRLKPMAGTMRKSQKLGVGYFAQHQVDEFDLAGTALSHMAKLMPMATETKVRAHIGRFGFGADKAETKVAALSGGEKARLLFALMSREAPHLMILDEPTNHLDIDAREALVAALNSWDGAVILISHDARLIELCADRLLLVDGGRVTPFDGDMNDYEAHVTGRMRSNGSRGGDDGRETGRDRRRNKADNRAGLAPLRRQAQEAEKEMARLTRKRELLQKKMAEPDFYASPAERITAFQKELADVASALEKAEMTWLEAEEALGETTV
ncbi:MAG: ABC-F family ATP-binding cassette domain-containing protein [Rhodospirillales bacterium]